LTANKTSHAVIYLESTGC